MGKGGGGNGETEELGERMTGEREFIEKGALKTSEGAPNTSSIRDEEGESGKEEIEMIGERRGGGGGMLKRVGQTQVNIRQEEQYGRRGEE